MKSLQDFNPNSIIEKPYLIARFNPKRSETFSHNVLRVTFLFLCQHFFEKNSSNPLIINIHSHESLIMFCICSLMSSLARFSCLLSLNK